MIFTNICVGCNEQFDTTIKHKKYCDKCRKNGIPYVCVVCGKEHLANCATHSRHANNGTLATRRCQLCAVKSVELREKQAKSAKETWAAKAADHPHKVSATQRLKDAWKDPEVVAKHKATMNLESVRGAITARNIEYYTNPKNREHASKKNIEVWQRPEHRAKWSKGGSSSEKASKSHKAHWDDVKNRVRREDRIREVYAHTELTDEVYKSIQTELVLYAKKGNLTEKLLQMGARESVIYIRENSNNAEMWQELIKDITAIKGKCCRVDLVHITGYAKSTVIRYCLDLGLTGIDTDHRGLQNEVEDFISSIYTGPVHIDKKYPFILSKEGNKQQLDIYLPKAHFAVEVNGVYWHSTAILTDREYHFNKSKQCRNAGIRLLHVWEHEWDNPIKQEVLKSIIKSALGLTQCVNAANFKVVYKLAKEVNVFFDSNTVEGFCDSEFALCLVDEKDVIWMAYLIGKGKHICNTYEVVRGASKLGYTVIGGSSKLMNTLFADKQLSEIVYYVDYNYFAGLSLMNDARWELLNETVGTKDYWLNSNTVKNSENMKIYDAGTATYIYRRKNDYLVNKF